MGFNKRHVRKFLEESQEYQEFRKALAILGDKWSALIIISVFDGPKRFSEIQKLTEGISPRTLTQRLSMLETEGMISRQVYKEFPPRIEYSVTEKAIELKTSMMEIKKWAHKYYRGHSTVKRILRHHSFFI